MARQGRGSHPAPPGAGCGILSPLPELFIATERRPGRIGAPRYELSTEDGDLLGYATQYNDIEPQALALSNPGDILRIELADGTTQEILL